MKTSGGARNTGAETGALTTPAGGPEEAGPARGALRANWNGTKERGYDMTTESTGTWVNGHLITTGEEYRGTGTRYYATIDRNRLMDCRGRLRTFALRVLAHQAAVRALESGQQ